MIGSSPVVNASPIENLLSRLAGVKKAKGGWTARCPAHDDKRPSLSVAQGKDGAVVIKCHKGCDTSAVLAALGLTLADLFPQDDLVVRWGDKVIWKDGKLVEKGKTVSGGRTFPTDKDAITAYKLGEPTAIWKYQNGHGEPVGLVVRWDKPDGKAIRPITRNGDGWLMSAMPEPRPLYRLPELAEAKRVVVVEGEKCADAARALGFVATTSSGGCKAGEKTDWSPLAGKDVWLLPDNDDGGRNYVVVVAGILEKVTPAPTLYVVGLPGLPEKGDIVDWIAAHGDAAEPGGMRAEIEGLAKPWENKTATATGSKAPDEPKKPEPVLISLASVQARKVHWLWRPWIARGAVSLIDGDPGLGKSTITCDLAARISRGWAMPPDTGQATDPAAVLLLSAEDSLEQTIRPRLDAMGADVNYISALIGVRSDEQDERPPVLPWDLDVAEAVVMAKGVVLIVVDPFMAFLDGAIDAHRDSDVRRCMHRLKILAERMNAAILIVRHLNKLIAGPAMYRGGGSIGITGACRSVMVVGRDPAKAERCVLAPVKNNLARFPPSLTYNLDSAGDVGVIAWGQETTLMADDILQHPTGHKANAAQQCADVMGELLPAGSKLPSEELEKTLEDRGFSEWAIKRARKILNVNATRDSLSGRWFAERSVASDVETF
jgi:hypothetical protein